MAIETEEQHQAAESKKVRVCRNCGQEVPELYCSSCGQSSKEIRVSSYTLFLDFLGDYFTFDSKFFRSIIPLFIKPGFLTSEFLQGRRVRYIPPLRFYIFSSILFFLTLAWVRGGNEELNPADGRGNVAVPIPQDQADGNGVPLQPDENQLEANQIKRAGPTFTDNRFDPDTRLGRYVNQRLDTLDRKIEVIGFDAFMRELVNEFLSSLPQALFLLMPFFALLLKMCYLRSAPLYIDHLIFAFHYHAFAYVLTSLLLIAGAQTDVLLAFSIFFGFVAYPIYLLIAMKRVYEQSWLWTLLKFFVVSSVYFTCLAIFVPFFFIFTAVILV